MHVGSNGYANKLKYLFLCKSVVIFVRDGSGNREFFESQVLPGTHYYSVRTMAEVPVAVRHLRAHPQLARTIASAGASRTRPVDANVTPGFESKTLRIIE